MIRSVGDTSARKGAFLGREGMPERASNPGTEDPNTDDYSRSETEFPYPLAEEISGREHVLAHGIMGTTPQSC